MKNEIVVEKEILVKEKYNDIDTKKEGSTIETPYKFSDTRRLKHE